MLYFEDIQLNVRQESTSTTLTKEEIISFAKEYDPQPFHIDEEAEKNPLWRYHFKRLVNRTNLA